MAFETPNPANSPIEKLEVPGKTWAGQHASTWDRLLRAEGVDPDLAQKLARAFQHHSEQSLLDVESNYRALEHWANIHTHGGFAGGGLINTPPAMVYQAGEGGLVALDAEAFAVAWSLADAHSGLGVGTHLWSAHNLTGEARGYDKATGAQQIAVALPNYSYSAGGSVGTATPGGDFVCIYRLAVGYNIARVLADGSVTTALIHDVNAVVSFGIDIDSDGFIYVAKDTGVLYKLNPDLTQVWSLAVARARDVAVEFYTNELWLMRWGSSPTNPPQKYDRDGNFLLEAPSSNHGPSGGSVDHEGRLLAAGTDQSIEEFEADGTLLRSYSAGGEGHTYVANEPTRTYVYTTRDAGTSYFRIRNYSDFAAVFSHAVKGHQCETSHGRVGLFGWAAGSTPA